MSIFTGAPGDAPPEAVPVEVPAGSEFDQSRDDTATSLTRLEETQTPDTLPQVAAPAPDDLSVLNETDTNPVAQPQTGAPEAALSAPETPEAVADLTIEGDDPVLPNPQALPPQAPAGEEALTLSTEPAQPVVPDTEQTGSGFPAEEPAPEPLGTEEAEQAEGADTGNSVAAEEITAEAEADPETAAETAPETVPETAPETATETVPETATEIEAETGRAAVAGSQDDAAEAEPMTQDQSASEAGTEDAAQTSEAATPSDEPPLPEPATLPETETAALPSADEEVTAPQEGGDASVPQSDAVAEDDPASPSAAEGGSETAQADPAADPETNASTIGNLARDVTTGRLPTALTPQEDTEGESAETEAQTAAAAQEKVEDTRPPLERFAAEFENPDDKPLMAIVLIDDGTSPIGPAALAGFPYPLSFAVDAARPDVAQTAAQYRAAGLEVLSMVNLPENATAADTEVTMATYLSAVPEAVAVFEGTDAGLQTSREATAQLAPILRDSGHGLVMFPNGLNTAQKLIAREGVPSATVFRDFDSKGQNASAIRRFLDQAAFRAGQEEGGVIMVGRLRPDTISALLLWGLQDRAASVALAPVSALLLAQ